MTASNVTPDMATKPIPSPDQPHAPSEAVYIEYRDLAQVQLAEAEAAVKRITAEGDELKRKLDALHPAIFAAWDDAEVYARLEAQYTALAPRAELLPLALADAQQRRRSLQSKLISLNNYVGLFGIRREQAAKAEQRALERAEQEQRQAKGQQAQWWHSLSPELQQHYAAEAVEQQQRPQREQAAKDRAASQQADDAAKRGEVAEWLESVKRG